VATRESKFIASKKEEQNGKKGKATITRAGNTKTGRPDIMEAGA
jgi:hypothetical protein